MIKEQHRQNIADILRDKVINLSHSLMLSKSNSKTSGETQKWFITQLCEKAALFYHKSIQIDTHNHQYYLCLARILHFLNRFDEALHWTNALKHLNPKNERIQLLLGNLYGLLGKD
jgi:tetratricopeptide (TPR) repeat protein